MIAAAQWNIADVWEQLAARRAEQTAFCHGSFELSWAGWSQRADALAAHLVAAGLERQSKVAQYCRNRPEYLEAVFACFKAGLVPVNTNYRYGDDELVYLFEDSDTEAVVFEAEFTESCARIRDRLPRVRSWIRMGQSSSCPSWAESYSEIVSRPVSPGFVAPWGRSGDDLLLLYTGGTTGMPKGVMWPQHDFFLMLEKQYGRTPPSRPSQEYLERGQEEGPRVLPGPPLMHGTACWFAMAALSAGGSVVTLPSRSFDPVELLDTVVGRGVKGVCIVGDPFARPLLTELEAAPRRWDLSGVRLLMSSGAMLSRNSKERLLEHFRQARLVDGLGSSESGSLGSAVSTRGAPVATARFTLGPTVRVIDGEGHDVVPGSGATGRLAIGGHLPLGYYKDARKTAETFLELEGHRYVVAGDWARVESDGTVTLLGRGSGCINTAGEKVYPEEVEEVLKEAAAVADAAVVGVPDEVFGEAVVALVALKEKEELDEAGLVSHVKRHLAAYKAPKRVLAVETVRRHANGKLDYQGMRQLALSRLGAAQSSAGTSEPAL